MYTCVYAKYTIPTYHQHLHVMNTNGTLVHSYIYEKRTLQLYIYKGIRIYITVCEAQMAKTTDTQAVGVLQ